MRTTRRLILIALTAALLAVGPSLSPVRADGALRSGTIVSGTGQSPANFWVRGMDGCVGAPACSAWLQSACDPALSGQSPAVHAAIVDVEDLADTERVLRVQDGLGLNWGGVMVQFWTGTNVGSWDYCMEIGGGRSSIREYARVGYSLRVPADAKWMTITSNPDNTNVAWTLS